MKTLTNGMKKLLLLTAISLSFQAATADEPISLTTNGKNCTVNVLLDRDLGPGVRYTRLRLPEYPLNVNMLRVDVTNPYNKMVTTQANDRLYSTESLVKAAARQDREGNRILAGTNANFWCVSPQPPFSDILIGYTITAALSTARRRRTSTCTPTSGTAATSTPAS